MTHVLAIRLDSDGDVLLTGPAVRAVAATADRVTLWCGPRGRRAAALLPGVDRLIEHPAAWIGLEPGELSRAAMLGVIDRLAVLKVDQAVIFTSFHQSPLPAALVLRMPVCQ